MGTITAQILVGMQHPNHGGIVPTHFLFLSENSRPAWTLVNQNISDLSRTEDMRIVWIPSTDNMVEDALVMVAIHVIKDKQIIDLCQRMSKNIVESCLEVYDGLTELQRQEIYQKCRRIKNWPKIIVTVMKGSSIEKQVSILKKYSLDAEVCFSLRIFSEGHNTKYSEFTQNSTIMDINERDYSSNGEGGKG